MIGWNDFVRGWVHHPLTAITIEHYGKECKNTHQFTGIEQTKEVIKFILEPRLTEWYHLYKANFQPSGTHYQNKKKYFEL